MLEKIAIIFLLFIIYSVLGWLMEVVVVAIGTKKVVNRGFLIGPYCPIYGSGSVLMIMLLAKYKDDVIALFVLASVICSILEYITSYVMEKLFKARWWDYSDKKFNINGRICLTNAVAFGVLGTLMMRYVNPFIMDKIYSLNTTALYVVFGILALIFTIDVFVSFSVISKVKQFAFEAKKDNTVEITAKVREMLRNKGGLAKRLLTAYPDLISTIKSKRQEIEERKEQFIKRVKEDVKKKKLEVRENIERFKVKK